MAKIQVNSQGKAYYTSNNKILLAKDLGTKSITSNGTYTASSDSLDGYSSVTVNVSGGGSATLVTKSITQNGTYNASSDNADGYSSVTVNVSGGGESMIGTPYVITNGEISLPNPNAGFSFVLPSEVTEIAPNTFENAFTMWRKLTSVDLSSLEIIGDSGLCNAFSDNKITSVLFPNLRFISYCGLASAFRYNVDRDTQQTTLQTVSFGALTSNSFESGDDSAFDDMLEDDDRVTVHFPSNLQSVIGNWQSVINGFNGTNTTILFDLQATE